MGGCETLVQSGSSEEEAVAGVVLDKEVLEDAIATCGIFDCYETSGMLHELMDRCKPCTNASTMLGILELFTMRVARLRQMYVISHSWLLYQVGAPLYFPTH